jgi:hypothetical protein
MQETRRCSGQAVYNTTDSLHRSSVHLVVSSNGLNWVAFFFFHTLQWNQEMLPKHRINLHTTKKNGKFHIINIKQLSQTSRRTISEISHTMCSILKEILIYSTEISRTTGLRVFLVPADPCGVYSHSSVGPFRSQNCRGYHWALNSNCYEGGNSDEGWQSFFF